MKLWSIVMDTVEHNLNYVLYKATLITSLT